MQLNRIIIPLVVLLAGISLNFIVVAANGGMPIHGNPVNYVTGSPFALNHIYVSISADTILPFLGDLIKFGDYVFAIGDILIYSGALLILLIIFKEIQKEIKKYGIVQLFKIKTGS